jgi:hypothetical protein
MSGALGTALAFARRGHAVFPVNWPVEENGRFVCSCMKHKRGPMPCVRDAAKHPLGRCAPNGVCSATVDVATIRRWFQVEAPDANLGVATTGLIVIDIDPRHDGDASLAALEREHGELPTTWRVLTGGGGEHIIYAAPEGLTISSLVAEQLAEPPLGRGIDVRARGGYIVAPPSVHISGRSYCWSVDHHPAETPLSAPPEWLIERLGRRTTPREPTPPAEWEELVTGAVREYRDMAIAKLAGHLLRRWIDPHVALSLLRSWNASHCVPPLTDGEVLTIVNRIANREADRLERERGR